MNDSFNRKTIAENSYDVQNLIENSAQVVNWL